MVVIIPPLVEEYSNNAYLLIIQFTLVIELLETDTKFNRYLPYGNSFEGSNGKQ